MRPNNKRTFLIILILAVLAAVFFVISSKKSGKDANAVIKEIRPLIEDVRLSITTTGVVEPQNRLEVKPPISGRIEEILVREGDTIKQGQKLAIMSSIDRAALLDAAYEESEGELAYWKDTYKPTPLLSPIDGEVIVRSVEPGQTVAAQAPVVVLSDRLIVTAQVDETDIGKVRKGQRAVLSLDAYPNQKIYALVDHIAYESKLVNNVTIYDVDIVPDLVPDFFRAGMSASVEIIEKERKDAITLPIEAIINESGESYVLIRPPGKNEGIRRSIVTGLQNDIAAEIVSGVTPEDTVIIKKNRYQPPKTGSSRSPFMPSRPKPQTNDRTAIAR